MTDPPFARATISPRGIHLHAWRPGLIDGGPGGALLRGLGRRSVVLADLIGDLEEMELAVRFVPRGAATDDARARLAEWAAQVGWRRLWLDDRVVDLDPVPAVAGRAGVRCPTCRLRWEDDRAEFWEQVREIGCFPAWCPACGGCLPEWRALAAEVDRAGRAGLDAVSDPSVEARPSSHHV